MRRGAGKAIEEVAAEGNALVDHNGMSLEMFGRTGRLWKTDTISTGGFREISLEDTSIVGEARQASPPG